MAGLIGLTSSDIELQDALRVERWEYDGDWIPHPVVRLTTTLPVAVRRLDGDAIVRARWGFPVGPRPVGNARDDKLTTSPMWSQMLGSGHCLVATTGIYEMVNAGGARRSFWFRRTDQKPIIMPGLAAERGVQGESRLCCAIVTTQPNAFFGRFHDRQVCALRANEMDQWLAGGDAEECMRLVHAPREDEWEAVPVDDRIFAKGRRELADLVPTGRPLRLGDALPGQQTLG
jgi:putative SOS response-associated peptidase YedK